MPTRVPKIPNKSLRNPWIVAAKLNRPADRLDIITVRVEHEGDVVVGVVLRSQARLAIVFAARSKRRVIKRIDQRALVHLEGDMGRYPSRIALIEPKIGARRFAKTGAGDRPSQSNRVFPDDLIADRFERGTVKFFAAFDIVDDNSHVRDHSVFSDELIVLPPLVSDTQLNISWREFFESRRRR